MFISKEAIKAAKENKEKYAKEIKVNYFVKSIYKFKTKEKFSHIVIGAGLKFFSCPNKVLKKSISLLKDGGYILASPFYIRSPIP